MLHLVFTNLPESAFRQAYFVTLDTHAGRDNGFSNIAGSNRTEQFAFFTGLGGDRDGHVCQLVTTRFCRGQCIGSSLLQFGTTLLKGLDVFLGGWRRLATGDKEITSITRFDVYPVTQVAQVFNFFQQNDFHRSTLPYALGFNSMCFGFSGTPAQIQPGIQQAGNDHHQQCLR